MEAALLQFAAKADMLKNAIVLRDARYCSRPGFLCNRLIRVFFSTLSAIAFRIPRKIHHVCFTLMLSWILLLRLCTGHCADVVVVSFCSISKPTHHEALVGMSDEIDDLEDAVAQIKEYLEQEEAQLVRCDSSFFNPNGMLSCFTPKFFWN